MRTKRVIFSIMFARSLATPLTPSLHCRTLLNFSQEHYSSITLHKCHFPLAAMFDSAAVCLSKRLCLPLQPFEYMMFTRCCQTLSHLLHHCRVIVIQPINLQQGKEWEGKRDQYDSKGKHTTGKQCSIFASTRDITACCPMVHHVLHVQPQTVLKTT